MVRYSLEIRSNRFDRDTAIRIYKNLQRIRFVTATYLNECKKIHATPGTAPIERIKLLKSTYRDLHEGEKELVFKRIGRCMADNVTFFARFNGENRHKAAKEYFKEIIQRNRRTNREMNSHINRRRTFHFLLTRSVNSILIQHQEKLLGEHKIPKDQSEYVGIEIECVMPKNADKTPLIPFGKYINVGSDGSIEYDSDTQEGREIRVLLKRTEIGDVIPKLMSVLDGMGATVNRTCGLHVHLDQRNNKDAHLTYQKLVRSLGLLYTVVPKSRRTNTYCHRNTTSDFEQARHGNRYRAINATAMNRYNTLEVRLFGGTLSATKIINWVETLEAIAHGEMVMRCPKNFDTARKYWNLSDENVAWLKARQTRFAPLNALAPTAESETEENQRLLEGSIPSVVINEGTQIVYRQGIAEPVTAIDPSIYDRESDDSCAECDNDRSECTCESFQEAV